MADLFDPLTVDPTSILEAETIPAAVISGPDSLKQDLETDFLQTTDDQTEDSAGDDSDCECGECFQCMIAELAESDTFPVDVSDLDLADDFDLIDQLLELEEDCEND